MCLLVLFLSRTCWYLRCASCSCSRDFCYAGQVSISVHDGGIEVSWDGRCDGDGLGAVTVSVCMRACACAWAWAVRGDEALDWTARRQEGATRTFFWIGGRKERGDRRLVSIGWPRHRARLIGNERGNSGKKSNTMRGR
ncbi:hypothetical protein P171DRAFT_71863 [Karstenula rhodostoma CBS 690.94]|uniref:Secreted protein n=1 Tax=Karstenula rhodostoma CBS 690.94 TaxID=1392251 RepID=A0A9P4PAG8_9PLEO|nr:hypothetical protein P171DRAFT_71863 [Karstenula rhodostoma CBS 690.94]